MEPPEVEEGEEEEEVRKKTGRKKLFAILAAAAVVGGVGVYSVFLTNQPPVAVFTYSAIDKKLSVSADLSSDPDGQVVSYQWDWGDQTPGTGRIAAHTYAQEGTYTITLTVRDDRNAEGKRSETLQIVVRPTADFDVSVDRYTIRVDGSSSSSQTGGDIVNWSWAFGDGKTATGKVAIHDYTPPGSRYRVTLTVKDQSNRVGNVSRYVSPADTTVDVKISNAHSAACPFEQYWQRRYGTYGDVVYLNTAGRCIDYYPWVLFTDTGDINPSFLYTLYRRVSTVRNHHGYTLDDPVILPVINPSVAPAPSSYLAFNYSVEYVGDQLEATLSGSPYEPNPGLTGDGFYTLLRGNLTMDFAMGKRIFGMRAALGTFPVVLDPGGTASGSTGASWNAFPSLPSPPAGPESTRWSDFVVTSDNTTFAIATDSTVYKLDNGALSWTPFIGPPTASWATLATDAVAIAADHEMTYYAITQGKRSPLVAAQVFRYTGATPGSWSLVANISTAQTLRAGGIADLVHVRGTGAIAALYAVPNNLRLLRDPVSYSPFSILGTPQWLNPKDGFTSNDKYTNATANSAISQYGFYRIASLEGELKIRSVEIGIEAKSFGDDQVQIDFSTDSGTTWTSAGTFTPGASDSTVFFNVTLLRSWDYTLLDNTHFRTRIAYAQVGVAASKISVDWIPVRVESGNSSLLQSANGGQKWASVGAATPAIGPLVNRALAAESPSVFYMLLDNGSVLRTTDSGNAWAWVPRSPNLPAGIPWQDIAWAGRNRLWVAANAPWGAEVWKFDPMAALWTNMSGGLSLSTVGAIAAADPQQWWYASTGFARSTPPGPEAYTVRWLDQIGNGNLAKYNIWEGFEWEIVADIIDFNGTVAPDGTTRVQVWWGVYGLDAMFMRWWYWGRANYSQAVHSPYGAVKPEGWAPEELCWCEHGRMVGNITNHLDLDYSSDAAYQWMAWANPGSDGTWRTPDDLPAWVYEPIYLDYVPSSDSGSAGAGKYNTSELTWWQGKTVIHAAPGSYNYGKPYEYLLAATRFSLKQGYTLTIRLPQGDVPWFDPVQSTWNPQTLIGNYVVTYAPITLRYVKEFPDPNDPRGVVVQPGTYFLWDPRTKVVSFAGPYDYGGRTVVPPQPEPWVEMQPEAVA